MAKPKRQRHGTLAKDISHFKRSLAKGIVLAIEADLIRVDRKLRKLYNLRMKS